MSNPIFKPKLLPVFNKERDKKIKTLIDCVEDLIEIVHGARCQEWRSRNGFGDLLKDTREWRAMSNAFHRLTE
jgi:hypothetical protein